MFNINMAVFAQPAYSVVDTSYLSSFPQLSYVSKQSNVGNESNYCSRTYNPISSFIVYIAADTLNIIASLNVNLTIAINVKGS